MALDSPWAIRRAVLQPGNQTLLVMGNDMSISPCVLPYFPLDVLGVKGQ